jgi:hypothetical protein
MRWSQFDPREYWLFKIYLTPFQKRWCSTEHKIDKCNVNSGQTTYQRGKRIEIEIFRLEDSIKVTIHEFLHAHDWDRLLPSEDQYRFPSEHEGLIEAIARFLYCIWVRGANHWEDMLKTELKWMYQTAHNLRSHPWEAMTHVMAYYMLATALLHSYPVFLKWLFPSDPNTTVSQMRKKWPLVRDECWAALFPDPLSAEFKLYTSTKPNPDACFPVKMVKHQIDLTVGHVSPFRWT